MESPVPPRKLRTEEEIINTWEGDIEKPLLSVRCTTYNHAPYIEDAIHGFLIQITKFPLEICIHDDASTDATQEIIKYYQKLYPRIIKPLFQTENQYSKGNKPGQFLDKKCFGKYLAFCEGDDYWVDPSKLAKQVEYLETHPECVITGHDAFIIASDGAMLSSSKLPSIHKRDYTARELAEGRAWILTMAWVYRNVISEYAPERNMVQNGDSFLTSVLGQYGGSHYHDDIQPAAYRVHAGGVWSSGSSEQKLDAQTNTWFWMYRYYKRIGKEDLAAVFFTMFKKSIYNRSSSLELSRALMMKLVRFSYFKSTLRKLVGHGRILRFFKKWLT